jgi:flagellar protein FliL
MAANATAAAKTAPESNADKAAAPTEAKAASGLKPWLPVIVNILLMPALAYATVTFLILPKMKAGTQTVHARSGNEEGPSGPAKEKIMAPLGGKIIVNVAGTQGTRYLLANLTLVGSSPALKTKVEANEAELRDAAAGALSVKTISDLEKPGARNLIRTELISIFNNTLGEGTVKDLYLTEFAIQ